MNAEARKRTSRALALVLRHKPWLFELELDEQGWTDAIIVLDGLRDMHAEWHSLSLADLQEIVETSDKSRYELSGSRIRALYGHSIPDRIEKIPALPPDTLYHGTTQEALSIIQHDGLRPMGRQYVHCAVKIDMARQVGNRKHGQTVILSVAAAKAYADKIPFYRGNEFVWLADYIPFSYLTPMDNQNG